MNKYMEIAKEKSLWQVKQLLFLKNPELLKMQSKKAAKKASIPNITANTTKVVLPIIAAINNITEKNTSATNIGHLTILFISIAKTIVVSINAKNISIVIIYISFYVFDIFYEFTYILLLIHYI